MRKQQRVALVGAGKFTDSPLSRLRNLAEHLGPVKAPSLRVASRIANSLRGGHPVRDYEEFERCTLVLISVPDEMLPGIVEEMAAAPVSWVKKTVLVCCKDSTTEDLKGLAELGANTGSLEVIPGFGDRWFLLEGRGIERQVRPLIEHRGVRTTVIEPGQKLAYLSGMARVGPQFVPILKKAAESLRKAGIPSTEVAAILGRQVNQTLRSYFRSGKGGDEEP